MFGCSCLSVICELCCDMGIFLGRFLCVECYAGVYFNCMYVVLEFMCVKGICVMGLFDCRGRMGG